MESDAADLFEQVIVMKDGSKMSCDMSRIIRVCRMEGIARLEGSDGLFGIADGVVEEGGDHGRRSEPNY